MGCYIIVITTCNRKLDYHDSCTLCKSSDLYPRIVISSLVERLEKPLFCHSYTSFGVWSRDHYTSLQRSTAGVCHAFLQFFEPTALLVVLSFPAQTSLLHHVGKVFHKV
jgi:hypothetical protein